MDFATKTVEEVTETLIDYRGKTPPKSDAGVRLITAKVIKGGFITDDKPEFILDEFYDTWMRRGLPKQGDILITTEAPLGEVAQLRTSERVALAQRVILLRGDPDVIDQRYYFQCLKSDVVQGGLKQRATGTTVLGIKQSELRKVLIPWYPLPIQRRIADILSAYDDLIENNLRRIQILEEMARNLYREWFVKFRFPLYRSDGTIERIHNPDTDPMVDSELGPIPKGWEVTCLGDLCSEVRQTVKPDQMPPCTPYIGLEHIPRRSITLNDWGNLDSVQSTKLKFKSGEILFGKIRPYFHKVAFALVGGVCSTDAIVIVPNRVDLFSLVLSTVSSDEFVSHATQTSQGTKMPRANWKVMTEFSVPLAPSDLLNRFNCIIDPIIAQCKNLALRNRPLAKKRDLLLPRLVSGQLDVSEFENPA